MSCFFPPISARLWSRFILEKAHICQSSWNISTRAVMSLPQFAPPQLTARLITFFPFTLYANTPPLKFVSHPVSTQHLSVVSLISGFSCAYNCCQWGSLYGSSLLFFLFEGKTPLAYVVFQDTHTFCFLRSCYFLSPLTKLQHSCPRSAHPVPYLDYFLSLHSMSIKQPVRFSQMCFFFSLH